MLAARGNILFTRYVAIKGPVAFAGAQEGIIFGVVCCPGGLKEENSSEPTSFEVSSFDDISVDLDEPHIVDY